jgi:hypothetical protein
MPWITRPPWFWQTPDVVVVPVMAIHGSQVPWGKVVMDGVPVADRRPTGWLSARSPP